MRITNNMIMGSTKTNINSNKINVNTLNNQMTSQKKIDKPSDDPVIAVRALRLRSNLSQLGHYKDTNIKEVSSWLDTTETALDNIRSLLNDIRTQCNNGSTGTLNADDRNTILSNLEQLRDQIYSEGNADYAGRTVFTGYKTNSTLTFLEDTTTYSYELTQNFTYADIEEYTYNYNQVSSEAIANLDVSKLSEDAATAAGATGTKEPDSATAFRIRLAYDDLGDITTQAGGTPEITMSYTDSTGAAQTQTMTVEYKTTEELEEMEYEIPDNAVYMNKETGELIFGKTAAESVKQNEASVSITYQKTSFESGDLKPEMYFNCTRTNVDTNESVEFTHYDENGDWISEDIHYTVATNQSMAINIEANDVLDSNIGRDIDELSDAVQKAIDAHDKVDTIEKMMEQDAYADDESQEKLALLLEAANKEATYADERMEDLYSEKVGTFQSYITTVDLAITDVGARGDRLELTENRVTSQYSTVEKLASENEDAELSDIVIDYTSAYLSYQASLQAAAKLEQQTLLDYI